MDEIENLIGARACNRDASSTKPGAQKNCSDIFNISIFFDGTGHNVDANIDFDRWAKPARLSRSAKLLVDQRNAVKNWYHCN